MTIGEGDGDTVGRVGVVSFLAASFLVVLFVKSISTNSAVSSSLLR